MKQLIEDYKRRLDTINQMIENFKSNGSVNDIRKDERLKTKAAEFRTFIAEMERELGINREFQEPTKPEDSVFEWDLPSDLVPETNTPEERVSFVENIIHDIDSKQQSGVPTPNEEWFSDEQFDVLRKFASDGVRKKL